MGSVTSAPAQQPRRSSDLLEQKRAENGTRTVLFTRLGMMVRRYRGDTCQLEASCKAHLRCLRVASSVRLIFLFSRLKKMVLMIGGRKRHPIDPSWTFELTKKPNPHQSTVA